jgi:hypothetical protein
MIFKSVNISEAIRAVKKAGASKVRAIPMEGQNVHTGNYRIEIVESGTWMIVAEGMPKAVAEGIIAQATSNVLLE